MGIRYSKVEGKFQREIVLLKSFPCAYGKCSFCNYIEDNSNNEEEINEVNLEVLKEITGEFGILEVINSGSVFEIPKKTLEKIREVVYEKDIKILYFEIFYSYLSRLDEIINYFNEKKKVEIRFRMGIESFDNDFRRKVYNKNIFLDKKKIKELSEKIYSVSRVAVVIPCFFKYSTDLLKISKFSSLKSFLFSFTSSKVLFSFTIFCK